jgi:outer membrane protein TolC
MKTTAYKTILIILIALGSRIVSNGQHFPDSLVKYLETAAKENPGVLQKFSEYQAALQKIPQVGSLSDPQLSLGVFMKPMELVSGNQVADIRLMQMFPWFGVLKNAKDEMSLMANARFELFRDTKAQLFFDVQSTWYELYKINKEISAAEKNIEILGAIERIALVRFKAASSGSPGITSSGSNISSGSSLSNNAGGTSGMQIMGSNQNIQGASTSNISTATMQTGSMGSSSANPGLSDLYTIQIEAGELENNIALLENQKIATNALFNSYLNRPPDSQVSIVENLGIDSLDLLFIVISDSILANNPMLNMLGFENKSLEARKRMSTRMGYPMIGLGLNYSLISKNSMSTSSMNGSDMIMPMITVTLPIYRKKYNAMVNEAEMLKNATSQNYQATSNSLRTEYYKAVQNYQDAQRRVKLYENQYQLASKSLDLILKSYSASSAGLTDVLRVRQQTLDYELKKVEAIVDLSTAVAWLNRLMAFSQIQ